MLVLVICLAALATIVALTFNIDFFHTRNRPEQNVTQVAGADIRAEDLVIGEFREIKGTKLLYATLAGKSEHMSSGSSYGRGDSRNLLFFDTTTKQSHWLLNGNAQSIPSIAFITNPSTEDYECNSTRPCDKDLTTQSLLLEIEPLTPEGKASETKRRLVLASPDGKDLVTIADGIDALLGKQKVSSDALLVFYSVGGAVRVAELDSSTRTVKSDDLLSAHE